MKYSNHPPLQSTKFLAFLIFNLFKRMKFTKKSDLEPLFQFKSNVEWFPYFVKHLHMLMVNGPSMHVLMLGILYLARIGDEVPDDKVYEYFIGCVQLAEIRTGGRRFEVFGVSLDELDYYTDLCKQELGDRLIVEKEEYEGLKQSMVNLAHRYQAMGM